MGGGFFFFPPYSISECCGMWSLSSLSFARFTGASYYVSEYICTCVCLFMERNCNFVLINFPICELINFVLCYLFTFLLASDVTCM